MRRPRGCVPNCRRCRFRAMPIPPDTLREFMHTEYRVRLSQGGGAVIRIGEPLPRSLQRVLRDERECWGFITAWNPFAREISRARNRERQRELLNGLRERGARVRTGAGVGESRGASHKRWREPGLFVTGLDFDALDELGRRFGQAALVRGIGHDIAELHVLW